MVFYDAQGKRSETEIAIIKVSLDEPAKYVIEKGQVVLLTDLEIDPETINLNTGGRWITTYLTLPGEYDVNDIDIGTVCLEYAGEKLPAERGDVQGNNTLMVKFNRQKVAEFLEEGEEVVITVTGEIDGLSFIGKDSVRVIGRDKK